jgi:hypothetical protein
VRPNDATTSPKKRAGANKIIGSSNSLAQYKAERGANAPAARSTAARFQMPYDRVLPADVDGLLRAGLRDRQHRHDPAAIERAVTRLLERL